MEAFELATSFLANMFAVVLIGLVLTETIPYCLTCIHMRTQKSAHQGKTCVRRILIDHLVLLLLVAYKGGLTLYTTLVPDFSVQYSTLWVHAGAIMLLFAVLSFWRPWRIRTTAGLFLVSTFMTLLLAQSASIGFSSQPPAVVMLLAENVALFSFYFFIIVYAIAMRTDEYEQYVSTQKLFSWRRSVLLLLCTLPFMIAAATRSITPPVTENGGMVTKSQEVTVRLKWMHSAQFAGLYMADTKGMYREVGIRPVFVPYTLGTNAIDEVVDGNADFGIAGGLEIVRARAEGKSLIALAAFYQHDPLVPYTLASSSLVRYEDIITARVGADVVPHGFDFARTEQLQQHGIDPYALDAVYAGPNQNEALLSGTIDVAFGYETSQVDQLRRMGYDVRILESNIPHGYGDVLFTTEATFARYPEMVAAFTNATQKGWEAALAFPDEAVTAVLSYDDGTDITMTPMDQHSLLEAARPYLKPTESFSIGSMSIPVWQSMIQSLYDARMLTQLITPEEFVYLPPK